MTVLLTDIINRVIIYTSYRVVDISKPLIIDTRRARYVHLGQGVRLLMQHSADATIYDYEGICHRYMLKAYASGQIHKQDQRGRSLLLACQ